MNDAFSIKDFSFQEMVTRLNKAFPEFDIAGVQRVIVEDRLNRVIARHAWKILISEKIEDRDKGGAA